MSKEEFLKGLEEALSGEVPVSVIRDNLNYYNSYISQEMAKGRTVEEIAAEIGEPRIVARTIIDSCEAAGETVENGYESYESSGYSGSYSQETYEDRQSPFTNVHYFDLSKWYWKLLALILALVVGSVVLSVVGGVFAFLIHFSGPILVVLLVIWIVKNARR